MNSNPTHLCLGPSGSRRQFLASTIGGAISLGLAQQSLRAEVPAAARKKSCILLWMNGGPSHLDTLDPRPGTATGGSFKAITTKLPGVSFAEHLPLLANQADKLAIVRSMTSKEGNHDRGRYLMHTGYSPSVTVTHPSLGAWVSHELGDTTFELPNFVSIRGPSLGSGFLGTAHNPFVVQNPSEGVRNVSYPKDVDAARFEQRLRGLQIVEGAFAKSSGPQAVAAPVTVRDKAVRLMRSPQMKAFELSEETAATRSLYGNSDFGRGCLMARRLVETGVRFVEVMLDGWDTHVDNFSAVRRLCQELDPAMSGLLSDLADRKLLDDTLVIWMGEFGRTPKISALDGRDHHPAAWSAALAGSNVAAGQVYGSTDETGAKVSKDPVTVPDFFATVATLLGIDPARELMSPIGRPIAISENGKAVSGLIRG